MVLDLPKAPGPVRRAVTCGLTATVLGLVGCAQDVRLTPAPPPSEIPDLERRTAQAPGDFRTSVRLGAAYWAAGRLREAESELLRARDLDPGHPAPWFFLGTTYEDMARFEEARRSFEAYLERGASARLQAAVRDRLVLLARKEVEASVRAALAGEAELASPPPRANTVGLFPFLYFGADPDLRPLGRAVAELLATDLSLTDRLTVVERLRVQLLLDEIALGEAGATDPATAARAGRLLGAERVVQGHLAGEEESLLLEALVVSVDRDPADGASVSDRDALQRLFDLQKRVALDLYVSLGIELTLAERERIDRRPTEHIQALLAFGAGLEAGDGGRFSAAAAHFSAAATLDPGFAEAARMAEEARAMDAAGRTSTRRLALLDEVDLLTELAPEDWDRLQESLRNLRIHIPDPTGRDAVSETLGTEGFGPDRRGRIEFIFRLP
jgi:tetratricopeptide (TPR) repeat protein